MAKKCIPGVICIENMTLFILLMVIGLVIYMIYSQNKSNVVVIQQPGLSTRPPMVQSSVYNPLLSVNPRVAANPLDNPYVPPLKDDGYSFPIAPLPIGRPGIPVNIETRGTNMPYEQVGILTPMNSNNSENLILPLMGRRWLTGRDKWQYYTMANGVGSINAKLPVSVNGKSCTGEYGCDPIQNGDTIYVEGYKSTFTATVYENGTFSYIPYL